MSRTGARRFVPEGSVVGRQLVSGGFVTCPGATVIGVVGDVKYTGLGGDGTAVYEPMTQGWQRDANLFIRTAGPPAAALTAIRASVQSVDPGVPLDDAAPLGVRLPPPPSLPTHCTPLP